jgi:hypothetical protein
MFPDNKMRMLGVSSHKGRNQDHLGIYRTRHHPYNFYHDCDGGGGCGDGAILFKLNQN